MMTTPMITAKDLKKTYGEFEAVKGVSFEIAKGEIFGQLGKHLRTESLQARADLSASTNFNLINRKI